jgi:hypothetical protein
MGSIDSVQGATRRPREEENTMSIEQTAKAYMEIWNQTDPAERRARIAELFTPDCSYTDPMAAVTGRDGLDGFIAAVQTQFAGVGFALGGRVDEHHDVARFTWHARVGAGEPLAIGFDVIVLERGKIRQVIGFLDKAPKGAV